MRIAAGQLLASPGFISAAVTTQKAQGLVSGGDKEAENGAVRDRTHSSMPSTWTASDGLI